MVLVRLCILDLTQRLPDLVKSISCHWPLPPEDPWLCHHYTHTLCELDTAKSPGKHGTGEAVHSGPHPEVA